MPGLRPAKTVKKATAKAAVARASGGVVHKEWNGKGGFKPGNKYGKRSHDVNASGERGKLAADLRGARRTIVDREDRQTFARHAKLLKDHDQGKHGSITDDSADVIRQRLARIAGEHQRRTQGAGGMRPTSAQPGPDRDQVTAAQYAGRHGLTHTEASDHLRSLYLSGHARGGSIGGTYAIARDAPAHPNAKPIGDVASSPAPATARIEPLPPGRPKSSRQLRLFGSNHPTISPLVPEPAKPRIVIGGPSPGGPAIPKVPPRGSPEPAGNAGDVGYLDTARVHADPARFQYKLGAHSETGSVESLGGIKKFDHDLAGIVHVWKDPADGKTYVVNGHNRLAKAKELGEGKILARYLHAADAKEARSKGALINIAEGRGTSVDAAKYFRDSGLDRAAIQSKGITLREKVATEGLHLAALNDNLFNKVSTGQFPAERAAIIGSSGLNHDQQDQVVREVEGAKRGHEITNSHLREIVDDIKHTPTTKVTTHSLFGDDVEEKSLYKHKTKLQADVKDKLSKEKKLFGLVSRSKNAEDLSKAGNTIDAESSAAVSDDAAHALGIFDIHKRLRGPIADTLNHGAERIHNGEDRRSVFADVYKKILHHVKEQKTATTV